MTARSWARSGRGGELRAAVARQGGRPVGSWGAAVDRARRSWDALAAAGYSDAAAAAILGTALGLWADTAATMGAADGPHGDGAGTGRDDGGGPGV